jgi:hypothetical protein
MTIWRWLMLGTLVLAVAAPAHASTVSMFRTPSGNIGCVYASGLPGAKVPSIRCDIRSRLHPAPRRPGNCRLDYGDSFEIGQTGRTRLVCHGDTAIDPRSRVLGYGRTWQRGGLTCTSRTDGLTCSNRTGHGFLISRQRWRVF